MNDQTNSIVEVASSSTSSSFARPVQPAKKKRGFAAMNPDQVRELARRGGVAAHRAGTAHEFTTDEARAAGRKGGLATHPLRHPPSTTIGELQR
jgi:general stress protein YciG